MKLCNLGIHKYHPCFVFSTNITNKKGESLYWTSAHTGFVCIKCEKRKLKIRQKKRSSVGEKQSAYDWLNYQQPKSAAILTLVKK